MRWKDPIDPVKYLGGARTFKTHGNNCIQELPEVEALPGTYGFSEDCLFLNIFSPKSQSTISEGYPVLVWIHGGGLVNGGGDSPNYDGSVFAQKGVVVVTFNYRLGVLGFYASTSGSLVGNYGFMDQVQALKWINANIKSFGGNPNKVTIAGFSAGGASVALHLTSTLSRSYFHQAVMQSANLGSNVPYRNLMQAAGDSDWNAKKPGNCTVGNMVCLRALPVSTIIDFQISLVTTFTPLAYTANYHVTGPIPLHPYYAFKLGQSYNVPILAGANQADFSTVLFARVPFPITNEPTYDFVLNQGGVPTQALPILKQFYPFNAAIDNRYSSNSSFD